MENKSSLDSLKMKAKDMLLDGKTKDEIMRDTNLRLKDIKRIEKEIASKF